jgi:outer membrane receptor protein involved in Fe transport
VRRFALPLLLASTAASAQTAPDEIVITGRGLPRALGEEVYDSVAIGRDRLEASASNRLEEVLRDVPGFQLFRRSDARSANPTSQGATLRALGGNASSRALLILDGVPQTDPFGGWVSWPAYDPLRLGQVRVVRGGGSGAEGPGALAGTIELSSAGAAEIGPLSADLAYGSRRSLDAHVATGLATRSGFAMIGASLAKGAGFVPIVPEQQGPADRPSPYVQGSIAARAVTRIGGGPELQVSALAFTDDRQRGTALSDIATRGADGSLRLVGRRWSLLGYVQTRQFYNSFASANAARTAVTQTSEQYNVPSTGLGARGEVRPNVGGGVEVRLGGDWRETSGRTQERLSFVNGAATRDRAAGGRTDTLGGFAEAALRSGALTLTAGGRIDRWTIASGFLEERVIATGALASDLHYPDRSGWEPTGRAGFAWRVMPGLTLRSAAYLGWRLPTLNELYRPFRAGLDATAANPDLDPERLQGAEAGLDWRPIAGLRLGATLFANRLSGAIANVTLGQGPGTFPVVGFVARGGQFRTRENLGSIVSRGVELDGRWEHGPWSLAAGYSYADARVHSSGAALPLDGLRPAQTPRHMLSSTLAWRSGRGALASMSARYVSAQYEDDLNRQRIPGALTFDAAAALPLGKGLAIEVRAENIADKRVIAGISGDGILERATPRTLWVGLRYRPSSTSGTP